MDKNYYPIPVSQRFLITLSFIIGLFSASSSFANYLETDLFFNTPIENCSRHLPGLEKLFVPQVAPPVINAVASTNPTDCNVSDGTITIDATGDQTLEYSINFGASWQSENSFTGLPASDYTILVRNVGDLADVAYINNPVTLVAPNPPTIFGVTNTDPSDCTNANGIISVGALPGDGSPEYSIDGGQTWFASGSFTNLPSGNYFIYARNDNGTCSIAYANNPLGLFSADSPDIQSVTSNPVTACAAGDGQIVIVGNGTSALQYSIDNGANWRTVNTFDNLEEGDYDVVIQYADGTCQVPYGFNPVQVTGPVTPEFINVESFDITDCGADDGIINIHATPGVGVLEYSIDGGFAWQPDSFFTNLPEATYNIKVRFLDGSCELDYRSNPIDFTDPAVPFIIAVNSNDPTGCNNNDGDITILATGDRELFYSIDGGNNYQTNNIFSDLPAGAYDIIVTYAAQTCSDTAPTLNLVNDGSGSFTLNLTDYEACLNGAGIYPLSDANISINGGAMTTDHVLAYTSTDGSFADSGDPNTTFTPNNNTAGNATINVMVTDTVSGCVENGSLTFTLEPSPITNMIPDSICVGGNTTLGSGSVGLHQWTVISGDVASLSCMTCPSPIADPGETTVYRVEVSNVLLNTCVAVDSVEIFVHDEPVVLNHVDTFGLCNGNTLNISLELNEPIANYTISTFAAYDNVVVNGNTISLDATLTGNLAAYSIELIGASTCNVFESFVVERISDPTAAFTVDLPTCEGSEVSVNFTGTASSNANLNWDLDGGTLLYSSPAMGGNPAGSQITASWSSMATFEVKLTVDDGGCIDRDTMNVTIAETAPQLSSTVTPASSCGTSQGAIDLTATGANNQFAWEGPNGFNETTEDINNLETGFYAVTVTDALTLCYSVATIEVGEDGFFNCTDYIRVLIPAIDPFGLCLDDVVNLPGSIISANVCGDDPATVTVAVNQTDDCITLDPNDLFVGEDTVCVVHCDGNAPQFCDTTFVVVMVSPPTDTIQVNVLGDIQSEICIPAGVLQIGGTITSSAFCGTGDPSTVQGISIDEECVIVRANPGFTGLAPDRICVVNCYDNFALFCDTTYIEITVDPNNCTDLIAEEDLNISLSDCSAPVAVCLGISFSNIANYTLTDNGSTYSAGFVQCGTDSTEVMLTQGQHVLVFNEIATGCPDTVRIDVDNGLNLYSGPTTFDVDCDSILTICLDIPFADAADYQITDNGLALITGGCGLDSFYSYDYSTIPGQGGTGPYLLQNWTVNGSVFIGSFNTIAELVDSMNVWDPTGNWQDDSPNLSIVGGDFANTYSATIDVSQVLGGPGTITLGVGYEPSNVSIQLDTGYHQVQLTYTPSNCFETIVFEVNCVTDPGCLDVFVGPINLNAPTCDDAASFCTGISPIDFMNYNVYDNGQAFAGNFSGCDNTEFINYSFAAVPGQGNTGPYNLISWSVGINIYSGISFTTLNELVDSMNAWEPAGNWMLNGVVIEGGSDGRNYGTIIVEFNGTSYPVYPAIQIISASTAIELDTGFHQLVLEYLPTGCLDTVDITVNCVDCVDFIAVQSTSITINDCAANASYCVDLPFATIGNYTITDNNFPYNNGTVTCPGSGGLATQLALATGVHELIFTETATGCSDTVQVIVNCINSSTIEIELLVNTLDTLCADDSDLLGTIVSIENACEAASGETVVFTQIGGTNCYEVSAMELGTDTACIVLCDATVCDTTYMIVTVVEELTPDELPMAVADATTTVAGQQVSYNVLANDSINGTLDTFFILSQPDNGFAWYDSTGFIHYQPDAEFCDFDNPEMMAYEVCNENGCDTSELLITVICDELKTFSGFSPNGDGVNDAFMIQGAEAYPNNELLIFSRWGTLILKVSGYQNDWDGTWDGAALPEGTYFYMFDTGEGNIRNGYLQIHR